MKRDYFEVTVIIAIVIGVSMLTKQGQNTTTQKAVQCDFDYFEIQHHVDAIITILD
jgi:hypothetical protein